MGSAKSEVQNSKLNSQNVKSLHLPITKRDTMSLHAGDIVSLQGLLVTGRDKLHRYLFENRPPKKQIPFRLDGTIIYHCGPIIAKTSKGYSCVACGPTTSMRVESYASKIIASYGIRGIMGKGGMGKETLNAFRKYGGVYFHTIGGAAVYLADRVQKVAGVWKLEEFGMAEAMWILEVRDFPAIVTMDAFGKSLHDDIAMKSGKIFNRILRLHKG